jgi:hypothetical protein
LLITSKNGSHRNLIIVLPLLFLIIVPIANSLITYTSTVVMTPQYIITMSDPDSARILREITAESDADSGAAVSEDILNLLIDDDLGTGEEIIYNHPGNNKDYAHWYRIDSESSDYFKVEIRVYFSTLEVTPYEWRVFVYQADANNINTGYYVDGISSATGWTTIDVTSIIHQLDGQGFMKVRLISKVGQANKEKIIFVSEMEWQLTA